MKKLSTAEFVAKAIGTHGQCYEYSLVNYTNAHEKIKIVCLLHGIFEQTPNAHLNGRGCPLCGFKRIADARKLSKDEFVRQARSKHDNIYDYSLVSYLGNKRKVKIGCYTHGIFEQSPNNHLRGAGCPVCAGNKKQSTASFIRNARGLHGETTYDYSFVDYKNAQTKVKIGCYTHGIFEQKPNGHLSGAGCPGCAGNKRKSTEGFIQDAMSIHGETTYDYSFVDYSNDRKKIKIGCYTHGIFEQSPSNHLRGNGCPVCAVGGFDPSKPGILYFLKFEKPFASFWKVGITNRTVQERFRGDFSFITLQHTWELENGFNAYQIEQSVLRQFKKYRFDDSFLFSLLESNGDTECFVPTMPHQKVIDFIEARVKSVQSAIAA